MTNAHRDDGTQHYAWVELARRALQLSLNDQPELAWRTVVELATEHGAAAVPAAMQAWIDSMLIHRGLDGFAPGRVHPRLRPGQRPHRRRRRRRTGRAGLGRPPDRRPRR